MKYYFCFFRVSLKQKCQKQIQQTLKTVSSESHSELGTRNWELENAEKFNEKEEKTKEAKGERGGAGKWKEAENYKWNKQK